MAIQVDLSKLREVDFEVKREVWNKYKLSDGSILRLKVVVTKFLDTGETDPNTGFPRYIIAYQNLIAVTSDERGAPSNKPIPSFPDIPKELLEEINIVETIYEEWNTYIVDNKYVYETKPVITSIYRIKGLYDATGCPVYHIFSQLVHRVKTV